MDDLVDDLQIKIVSHVASNSIVDLFNVMQTCKSLYLAGTHRCVLQNATVWDKFHDIHSRHLAADHGKQEAVDGVGRFVKKCVKNDNIEAVFCRGMEDYFLNDPDKLSEDEAIRNMKIAAAKGVVAAKHVCRIYFTTEGEKLELFRGNRSSEDELECRRTRTLILIARSRLIHLELCNRLFKLYPQKPSPPSSHSFPTYDSV